MIETLERAEVIATYEQVVCPSGVVSLYDVLQFYGDFFTDSMGQFNAYEAKLSLEKREIALDQHATLSLYAKLGVFAGVCTMHKLSSPAQQCGRIMENLQNKHMIISCGEMRDDLRELRRRCEDEFKAAYFIHLEPAQAEMYQHPDKDWSEVVGKFYKVKYNIEESGICFALGAC
jgi:hypothetical protein